MERFRLFQAIGQFMAIHKRDARNAPHVTSSASGKQTEGLFLAGKWFAVFLPDKQGRIFFSVKHQFRE